MGIFDFIKTGVREMMIARPDDKKDLLVWKHPDPTIPMHSQLTVDADEAAVFFRDGSIVGVLRSAGAGQRHTLDSENIPFLSNFVDKYTGGNIFVTDLYFVTMRPIYDVQFGGELGMMEDLGEAITPRIFGTFSFQIVDPALFILKYMGMKQGGGSNELLGWVKGLLINSIRTVMGQVLIEQQTSMLRLMGMQEMLAQKFTEKSPKLEEIGCRVVQMGQFNINLSDDDRTRLQAAQAELGAAKRKAAAANIGIATAAAEAQARQFELDQKFQQDQRYVQQLTGGNYMNYAAGQAMMGAGQGLAKGGAEGPAGAAASMGVGFAMANQFAQGFGGPQAQPAPAAGAPAAAPSPGGNVTCPGCKKQVTPGKFCAECGTSLAPPKKRFCSSCGAEGAPTARFCAGCGTAFAQEG